MSKKGGNNAESNDIGGENVSEEKWREEAAS
jgi:hypothetical protein